MKKTTHHAKRLFIVDDHAIVRTGLARLLETQSDLTVCGEAEDAAQAIEGVARARPDLVIVDLVLPGRDGLELIRDLSHRHPRILLLAFSVHDHHSYAERALRAGAKGYVCKSEGLAALLTAIRRLLAGQSYINPKHSESLVIQFLRKDGESKASGVELLSDRERDILRRIGECQSTRQIAAQLRLSEKTIQSYRESIKTKLNLRNARELTHFAFQSSQRPNQA